MSNLHYMCAWLAMYHLMQRKFQYVRAYGEPALNIDVAPDPLLPIAEERFMCVSIGLHIA